MSCGAVAVCVEVLPKPAVAYALDWPVAAATPVRHLSGLVSAAWEMQDRAEC